MLNIPVWQQLGSGSGVVVSVPDVTGWLGIHQLQYLPTGPTFILTFLKINVNGRTVQLYPAANSQAFLARSMQQ